MKTHLCLLTCLSGFALTSAIGQPAPAPAVPPLRPARPVPVMAPAVDPATGLPLPAPELTKFPLDFPGGRPRELVAAIQKATGKPLNVIVPDEFADTPLPELRMNNVDVAQLFQALEGASRKTEAVVTGTYHYAGGPQQQYTFSTTSYGFKTDGRPSDDSIWYFSVEKPKALPPNPAPPAAPRVCRFYALAQYLERGMIVDDITTAIETGWKMLGFVPPPGAGVPPELRPKLEISFHKDTKLLIAVGEPSKLEIIDDVLKALSPRPASPAEGFQTRLREIQSRAVAPPPPAAPPSAPPAPKPAEKPDMDK
jgi:hypothetical protein